MHILEHSPVSNLGSFLEGLDGDFFLTLSHGNIDKGSIRDADSLSLSDSFDFWGRIYTREQNEEDGYSREHLLVAFEDIERLLFNVSFSKVFLHKDS